MVETRRWELWGNLQGKKIHFPHFLSAVTIDGLRGIGPLRIPLDYPVTVIAEGTGAGRPQSSLQQPVHTEYPVQVQRPLCRPPSFPIIDRVFLVVPMHGTRYRWSSSMRLPMGNGQCVGVEPRDGTEASSGARGLCSPQGMCT